MNILHLKYAVEVAKTQSISKAADNLYMGQPNLSRAIKELEESLGITIFKRTSKGIITTPDGDEFLRKARRIVAQVDEVEELYRSRRSHKRTFSVCVPGAGYIVSAIAELAKHLPQDDPYEIFCKETNAGDAISGVLRGDSNLGVVRYQTIFERYFTSPFKEKKLIAETVAEFSPILLIRADEPLAQKESVSLEDLSGFTEISRGDAYVPSVPLIDIKKAEFTENVEKRIFAIDRTAQLELTASVPRSFMWACPISREQLDKYGLVMLKCPWNTKIYKDVLIYRKDYRLTEIDKMFITEMCDAKRRCFQ